MCSSDLNPNLLVWHGDLWVIDHGASLYFHHAWSNGLTDPARFAAQPWDSTDHVLERFVPQVAGVDAKARALLDPAFFTDVLARVPDAWLDSTPALTPSQLRAGYVEFLTARLGSDAWLPGVAR